MRIVSGLEELWEVAELKVVDSKDLPETQGGCSHS